MAKLRPDIPRLPAHATVPHAISALSRTCNNLADPDLEGKWPPCSTRVEHPLSPGELSNIVHTDNLSAARGCAPVARLDRLDGDARRGAHEPEQRREGTSGCAMPLVPERYRREPRPPHLRDGLTLVRPSTWRTTVGSILLVFFNDQHRFLSLGRGEDQLDRILFFRPPLSILALPRGGPKMSKFHTLDSIKKAGGSGAVRHASVRYAFGLWPTCSLAPDRPAAQAPRWEHAM